MSPENKLVRALPVQAVDIERGVNIDAADNIRSSLCDLLQGIGKSRGHGDSRIDKQQQFAGCLDSSLLASTKAAPVFGQRDYCDAVMLCGNLLELIGRRIRRSIVDKNNFRERFQEAGSPEGCPQWFEMLRHIIGGNNECDRGTCYHVKARIIVRRRALRRCDATAFCPLLLVQPIMTVFVCIGTIAELIKLGPVIIALRDHGVRVVGVATGQNDLTQSDIFPLVFPSGIADWVRQRPPRPTAWAFGFWAVACALCAPVALWRIFRQHRVRRPRLIVHGDTISTLIGSVAGWLAGAEIVHVEAGLRSFNLLRPFPEELCRVGVSKLATWAFCPGEWAVNNLRATRIRHIIDTQENTLVDAMQMALAMPISVELKARLPEQYFLFICHRQENLFDAQFLRLIVERMEAAAEDLPCVTILHQPALAAFEREALLDRLQNNPRIVPLSRQGYIDFTHLLQGSEYIVTDGGSNQEESCYLGKPCLVLRKETERQEGLGENVVLSMKDPVTIEAFLKEPMRYNRRPIVAGISPSQRIASALIKPAEAEAGSGR